MKILLLASCTAVGVVVTGSAQAAGTALDVQSSRATGMASTMTAHVDDSSAIYFNPAGIAQGKILDAQVGITPIVAGYKFTNTSGGTTKLPFAIVPPFHAYVSGGITDDLSIGIGVFTPFGLTLKWPGDWEGRHLATTVSNVNYYFNPTVAYRVGPLRIGAGFQLVRSTVELKRKIAFGDQEGEVDLGDAAWGAGANVGAQVEAVPKFLSFGLHYRSAVKISFDEGRAHFSNVPRNLQGTIHDQKVTTSLVEPNSVALGVSSRPIKDLLLAVDLVWFDWSKLSAVNLNFPDDASRTLSTSEPKNWNNTVNVHVGAEGALSENWRLRGGFLYDPSPSPSSTLAPDIPDANRLNLAAGGSYVHETGFRVDLGYQFLILFSKTSTNPALAGDYSGNVNILGLSVGYRTPPEKVAANVPPPEPAPSAPESTPPMMPPPEETKPVEPPPPPPETTTPPPP
jgi:long-chain fatty acid transport protein